MEEDVCEIESLDFITEEDTPGIYSPVFSVIEDYPKHGFIEMLKDIRHWGKYQNRYLYINR